jgi:glycosyltransferase involved in cell wall biosynthesis
MTLTTRDHTMLRAAYEAVYQGTPVIVSNWTLLREAFDEGALHVDNTAAGIADAVRSVVSAPDRFREGASRLRARKLARWAETRAAIAERLGHEAATAESSMPRREGAGV